MKRRWYFIIPAGIAGMVLFAFIGGEVVRLLWNWLLPPLFGWLQQRGSMEAAELARTDEIRREREQLRRQLLEKVIATQED